jgi:hypothetical protein
VEELLRREAAVLGREVGDHRFARCARAPPSATKLLVRVVFPWRFAGCH